MPAPPSPRSSSRTRTVRVLFGVLVDVVLRFDSLDLYLVWEGEGVIKYGRKLIGATDPHKYEPGTIRGDLGVVVGRNIIHGSDGPETAKDEIALWFEPKELVSYTSNAEKWVYGVN
ncbi:Nucleoside diphosphate kinase IV, chloroplastic/mitochondrial [Zea mays]|uniref:Nucleoside diphosphate kinase n=2 Tax=Zea mays TaxID=4577 RepID=A0A3L6G4U6_MAIZE|nr:hypothetical protein Zm00014a_034612 [Zea mays]PWZ43614.1 Nucleoside diphosphate kinase IV, chloroplastic/mitochondrial [Zea mays]